MNQPLLVKALCNPAWLEEATMAEWDLILRQARNADLMARLGVVVRQHGLLERIPKAPSLHLEAAQRLSEKQGSVVRYEAAAILQALDEVNQPLILLKGAAYVVADLPPARGRIFSDIDIIVPKARIDAVEEALQRHEWRSSHLNAYDQRYYRTWMHEIPPMKHLRRQTVIDVHHTILPETARLHPDPQKLLAAAVPVAGKTNIFVLAPTDMVLHSATHLFHDGELEHGLRDLVDLDALLRHFGKDEKFWDALIERAVEMELVRPLYYALRYIRATLQTPIPESALKASVALGRPALIAPLMDALFERALMPDHPSCEDRFTALARWLLYVRAHYLRMPLHLLLPHLLRKALYGRDLLKPAQTQHDKMRQMFLDQK